jgi:hypothetical protein
MRLFQMVGSTWSNAALHVELTEVQRGMSLTSSTKRKMFGMASGGKSMIDVDIQI